MTTPTSRAAWNHGLIEDYRANGKATSGPFLGKQLLLLTTTGSKTGQQRTTPLAYTMDGDRIVIVASMGGADVHPYWYTNIEADPKVTVELGRDTFEARATIAGPAERRRLYDQHTDTHPAFADYEKKTERQIPVVLLDRVESRS